MVSFSLFINTEHLHAVASPNLQPCGGVGVAVSPPLSRSFGGGFVSSFYEMSFVGSGTAGGGVRRFISEVDNSNGTVASSGTVGSFLVVDL